jgi:hypothetical protein
MVVFRLFASTLALIPVYYFEEHEVVREAVYENE